MQAIFDYGSVGDLWGLAIIGAAVLVLAANVSYQKHRSLACDRISRRLAQRDAKSPAKATQPVGGVHAHA
jgi:hypothetical protein